eukprot:TRINITY_DN17240_c0_g1_i1.p1 TRINITY_DN17240_c0_g1~~TRINITY_DN17240_c0_g1_i1.p1  ORF type:complete len:170 (+),score=29.78 TRINITY_DN17240_c0_g1_i1:580-1089(+)
MRSGEGMTSASGREDGGGAGLPRAFLLEGKRRGTFASLEVPALPPLTPTGSTLKPPTPSLKPPPAPHPFIPSHPLPPFSPSSTSPGKSVLLTRLHSAPLLALVDGNTVESTDSEGQFDETHLSSSPLHPLPSSSPVFSVLHVAREVRPSHSTSLRSFTGPRRREHRRKY